MRFLLIVTLVLAAACDAQPDQVTFRYEVHGGSEDVTVRYRPPHEPIVMEKVTPPWQSEEFTAPYGVVGHVDAEGGGGPLRCVIRYAPLGSDYGGSHSGVMAGKGPMSCNREQAIEPP